MTNHPQATRRVRTRFAPSPTGNLHIGGARTALFAYLWAKHNNGDFLLRVEDTDKVREVPGAAEEQREGLRWLGIAWDEGPDIGGEYGPYLQSQRLELYRTYAAELVATQKAYFCFCTSERLSEMRHQQQLQKQPPRYDRTCRRLDPVEAQKRADSGESHVIRLAVPEGEGGVLVHDAIRGELQFALKDIDDQVLMKSDGYPTYHLANVIDDYEMQITHVIRGEEWIPSTPKHVLLYQAFGWTPPVFAHLTVFLSKKGGKMSKRDGETALLAFRELGYLPEAVVNFSAFLGWNPKTEEEFFTLEQLTARFELEQINASNPVFETEKLQWMNQHYMRSLSVTDAIARMQNLVEHIHDTSPHRPAYEAFLQWFSTLSAKRQESVWKSLVERCHTLLEVAASIDVVQSIGEYQPELVIWKKSTKEGAIEALTAMQEYLQNIPEDNFCSAELQEMIIPWIKEKGWGNGDVLWPTRFVLSGLAQSPSPFELMEMLGKDLTIERIATGIQKLQSL